MSETQSEKDLAKWETREKARLAVEKDHWSQRKAAAFYNIALTTLNTHIKKRPPPPVKHGNATMLTDGEERGLVESVLWRSRRGMCMTEEELRYLASQVVLGRGGVLKKGSPTAHWAVQDLVHVNRLSDLETTPLMPLVLTHSARANIVKHGLNPDALSVVYQAMQMPTSISPPKAETKRKPKGRAVVKGGGVLMTRPEMYSHIREALEEKTRTENEKKTKAAARKILLEANKRKREIEEAEKEKRRKTKLEESQRKREAIEAEKEKRRLCVEFDREVKKLLEEEEKRRKAEADAAKQRNKAAKKLVEAEEKRRKAVASDAKRRNKTAKAKQSAKPPTIARYEETHITRRLDFSEFQIGEDTQMPHRCVEEALI